MRRFEEMRPFKAGEGKRMLRQKCWAEMMRELGPRRRAASRVCSAGQILLGEEDAPRIAEDADKFLT